MTPDRALLRRWTARNRLTRMAYHADPFAGSRQVAIGQIIGWRQNGRINRWEYRQTLAEIRGWKA